MIRSVIRSQTGDLRTDVAPEKVATFIRGGAEGDLLWVHISGSGEAERRFLLEVCGFHPLAVDDCFNGREDTPKIDDYVSHLFVVSQCVTLHRLGQPLDLDEIDLFLGKNFLVTVTQDPVAPVDELFDHACRDDGLLTRGADFLAHTVIDSAVDLLLPAVEEMDEALDTLEQSILDDPDKRYLPQLLLIKRNTLRLRRTILPQRDMVNRLSRGEYPDLIRTDALIFFRDVYDHIVRVEEMLEGLRDLADSALNSYLSSVNNRMNEVMKTLSIVAAIFLPLTLIASIYGTNLDLSPGVEFKHGFELMLVSMLAVAAALIGYFKYRRWF